MFRFTTRTSVPQFIAEMLACIRGFNLRNENSVVDYYINEIYNDVKLSSLAVMRIYAVMRNKSLAPEEILLTLSM